MLHINTLSGAGPIRTVLCFSAPGGPFAIASHRHEEVVRDVLHFIDRLGLVRSRRGIAGRRSVAVVNAATGVVARPWPSPFCRAHILSHCEGEDGRLGRTDISALVRRSDALGLYYRIRLASVVGVGSC